MPMEMNQPKVDRHSFNGSLAVGLGLHLTGCVTTAATSPPGLTEVASADRSWVQVAVSPYSRVFVDLSRWFGPLSGAVAEVMPDGSLRPYPDAIFNGDKSPASSRAVAVQSVVIDPDGRSLGIVDTGNPQLSGPAPGGAKLVRVDLATDMRRDTCPTDTSLHLQQLKRHPS